MTADNQQERPNYRLHYRARARDDWLDGKYEFCAVDDDKARQMAVEYVASRNKEMQDSIRSGKARAYDAVWVEPLGLERLAFVIKEVEERTPIFLQ